MARVAYLEPGDLPEEDRFLLQRPINLFRALANNTGAMKAFRLPGWWIRHECPLDPRLRELAILEVGYITGCAYEFSHHVKISDSFGVSKADIEGLIAWNKGEDCGLGPLERTVLSAARQLTQDIEIDDATWAALEAALETERLVELVMIIGHYNYVVRLLRGLKVDVEDDWAGPLSEYDPPAGKGKWR